ncbi:glutamine synthetase family protein [Lachnospiraceae bacterium C1.1]|nr:glutamine synthetase family protein [Lachnospiraceae bacterium C1.1]
MPEMSVSEVMDFIEENDVKFIKLAFCDYFGNQKNISVMPDELTRVIKNGKKFDSFRIAGYDDPLSRDLFLKPDLSTMCILPWRPQEGRVIRFYCDIITANGDPCPLDPRILLKETIKECQEYNLRPRIGLNSEFYLFRTDEDGNPTNIPWDKGGYCDIPPLDRSENIRREICLTMEEMGIRPETSHHENGPGQNEIDFEEDTALNSADNFITYKNVVNAISARNGIFASFAPKPLLDESGNGLHVKLSLFKDGDNLWDKDAAMAESFTAGVLSRMRDITVFLNTQTESYDRFGLGEAPKYITWSVQNGSKLLRIPEVNGKKVGMILRSPDSGINPYLAFSVILKAGMEGIRQGEKLPEAVDVSSPYISEEEKDNYQQLPLSLFEAKESAKNSKFIFNDDKLKAIAGKLLDILPHEKGEGIRIG